MYYQFWHRGCGHHHYETEMAAAWLVRKSKEALETLWEKGRKALDFKHVFFKEYIRDKSVTYQEKLEAGLQTDAKTLIQAEDPKRYEMYSKLRTNVWAFGAGSVKEEYKQMDLVAQALKDEGLDLAEEEVQKKLNAVHDRYQIEYKKIEDQTVEASGVMAEKWQHITKSGKMIKFVTVGDSHVRASHAKLDGIVKPAEDPFWSSHYPPLDYGCRCDAEETNDPEYTGKIPEVPRAPGLPGNVGKSGEVFTDKHPYLKDKDAKTLGAEHLKKNIRKDVKAFANDELRGDYTLTLNGKEIKASFHARQVKEFVSKYHPQENLRNEIIYDMKSWVKDLEFIGSGPNTKLEDAPWRKQMHYYRVRRMDTDFTLNVEEDNEGRFYLHALNEAQKNTP